jgi:class 3 adenylate cyclase/tetratricopeptide (TPR) repeat protein
MKCPSCQHENPQDSIFCLECGRKLEVICPQCNKILPPGAKFCNKCGQNLTQPSEPAPKELSFDEKLEKIQRYLPKGLTDKILSQKDKIEGERKQVTVMFCDLEGFTPLVERIGPEEAYAIMDEVYEILIHKVHDYEGTVNEMTGDGIMALFGAPIALEDAPQRAIRSAYSIHREMTAFSDKMKQEKEGIPPLKMRIGIHTGPVVVGTLGNDLRVEFKAVGDTVNLASRMEDLADPGATFVTEETFKLIEGFFRYESLGEKEVKGKEEPVQTYRVIGPSTRKTRFDISAERGLTPFVGREREIELLLDGFERVKTGRGQAFSIMSEAGVGKSRLLYEFIKAIANENVTILEGKCFSYSRGVTYHPIIDLFKSNFDISEDDEDDEIKNKVKRGLKQFDIDEASVLPYLLELLSVKDSGFDQIPISPEGRKERMIETMIRIPLKGSEIRPLIMVIEDIHWIDKSSEDALKYMFESLTGARILLIFTYRPDFVHTWGGRSYHNQVTLNRLSNRESLAMVNYLLASGDIEQDLEELILEKTEGIPFFIEEFVRSLRDLKVIEKKNGRYYLTKEIEVVTVPSTIQDVIMARVDALPEGAKELLQTGSVFEREFVYDLIKYVTDLNEQELLSYLSVLKDSELIYERGIYPQSTYIFKHALTCEVVYDSILTRRKKKLHEEIGKAMEELYRENIDEHYGVLAEHFIRSENNEKGAEYSYLAGRRAINSASFKEAIEHAEKCVICLERLPKTEAIQGRIIDARTRLANYMLNISRYVEAKEAVAPIADLAQVLGYQKSLPRIFTAIGIYYYWVEEDDLKGFRYLKDASDISEKLGDDISLYFANFYLGWCLTWNCEFEKGLECLNRSSELSQKANNLVGISYTKGIRSAVNYGFQGKIDTAYRTNEDILKIGEESGDIFIKAMADITYGVSCYYKGSFDAAEKHLLKGSTYAEKVTQIAWEAWAFSNLGHVYCDTGKYEKARDNYRKGFKAFEHGNMLPSMQYLYRVGLAKAEILGKEQDVNLNELIEYYEENKLKVNEGWMARDIGEILLSIDDDHMYDAEIWVKKAIEADNRNGMMWSLGQDYALYNELFKRTGDLSKAKETLGKAIEIFNECGADGWVDKYEKELAALL